LRVTRVRDLDRGAQHLDRRVILSTLAFLSRSLTLAISLPHLIAQVCQETILVKGGIQSALSCRSTAQVPVLCNGTELAWTRDGTLGRPQAAALPSTFRLMR